MREEDQRKSYWVDDTGKWLESSVVGRTANLTESIFTDSLRTVSQYGLVNVYYDIDTIHICWDVKSVQAVSLEAVLAYLERLSGKAQVVLKFFFGAWRTETFEGPLPAVARINQTRNYRGIHPFASTTVVRQDISQTLPSTRIARQSLDVWNRLNGVFVGTQDPEHKSLMKQMSVLIFEEESGGLIYGHSGAGSFVRTLLGNSSCDRMLGQRVDKGKANDKHCNSVEKHYFDLLNSDKPRVDHIIANIQSDTQLPVWHSYERLLLPVKLVDGTPAVVAVGDFSTSLSVSFMGSD